MAGQLITRNGFKKKSIRKTAKRRAGQARLVQSQDLRAAAGSRNDLQPQLELVSLPLLDLQITERRLRKIGPDQVDRICRSILTFGFIAPILIRGRKIVDGHSRLEAARSLGFATVPCIPVDHLTEAEARLLAISSNRLAETGEWDLAELKVELNELLLSDADLTVTGFTAQEIDIITLEEDASEAGHDDTLEPPETPVSRLGDLWLLDGHKVFCGSSLDASTFDAVLCGQLATAVFTDAPYNVSIAGNVSGLGKHKHGEFVMGSGEMSPEQFHQFLRTVHAHCTANLIDHGIAFSCMDWRGIETLLGAAREAGLTLVNMAVWNKGGGMGSFYRSAHELVAVLCNGASPAINNIQLGKSGRDRTNVWTYPGANRPGTSSAEALKFHATPKNLEMVVDAILDVTNRGDVVLDPFLGSGTTILAAEKAGRVGLGIELDPRFVDVTIRRWEEATGKSAIHAESRLTFADTAAARLADAG